MPDTDALLDWDTGGLGTVDAGTYAFSAGLDFGTVTNVRLTGHIAMSVVNTLDLIDERTTPIDDWPDIDGTEGAACDAAIWAQTTDDDPAGSPTWGPWIRIDSGRGRLPRRRQRRVPAHDHRPDLQHPDFSELRLKAEDVA